MDYSSWHRPCIIAEYVLRKNRKSRTTNWRQKAIVAGYLVTTIVCLGFAGCGGGVAGSSSPTTEPSPSNVSVALTVASPSLLLGKSTTLTATVSNEANSAVNWSVQNVPGGNTTVGTIVSTTNNGAIFTAPQFMPLPAIVAIRATSAADPTRTATVNITITSDVAVTIAPGTLAIELGAQLGFQATITSAGNPATAVLWSIGGAGCSGAACGAINSGGVFTAPQSLPSPPSVTLTATSVADPAKSSTTSITISSHFALTISALGLHLLGHSDRRECQFRRCTCPRNGFKSEYRNFLERFRSWVCRRCLRLPFSHGFEHHDDLCCAGICAVARAGHDYRDSPWLILRSWRRSPFPSIPG